MCGYGASSDDTSKMAEMRDDGLGHGQYGNHVKAVDMGDIC